MFEAILVLAFAAIIVLIAWALSISIKQSTLLHEELNVLENKAKEATTLSQILDIWESIKETSSKCNVEPYATRLVIITTILSTKHSMLKQKA